MLTKCKRLSKVLCRGAGQLQPRVSQSAEVSLGFARTQTLEMGRQPEPVKSIPPNTENSMQYGYDENDNNNMSNETKREDQLQHEQQMK